MKTPTQLILKTVPIDKKALARIIDMPYILFEKKMNPYETVHKFDEKEIAEIRSLMNEIKKLIDNYLEIEIDDEVEYNPRGYKVGPDS